MTRDPATMLEVMAFNIAYEAHSGQKDKAGYPYIGHVTGVVGRLKDRLERSVAWLHDVLEDTEVSAADLLNAGIPDEIVLDVIALTKVKGEPNDEYYQRVRSRPRALAVKLADVADNSDPRRLALLDKETAQRLTLKYEKARAALVS